MSSAKSTKAPRKPATPRFRPLPYQASGATTTPSTTTIPTTSSKTTTTTTTAELPHSLRTPAAAPLRVDPSSSAYKAASRKYTGFLVAMPILLVTSYVLFDRLALGHEAKSLKKTTPVEEVV